MALILKKNRYKRIYSTKGGEWGAIGTRGANDPAGRDGDVDGAEAAAAFLEIRLSQCAG